METIPPDKPNSTSSDRIEATRHFLFQENNERIIPIKTLIWVGGLIIVILLLVSPFLLVFTCFGLVLGIYSSDILLKKIKPFIIQQFNGLQQETYDPLLHPTPTRKSPNSPTNECSVCDIPSCRRNSHDLKPRVLTTNGSRNLKINARLDAAVARFSTAVFKVFVSPNWAPYEARKELRLTLVHLLTYLLGRFKDTLFLTKEEREAFVRDKVYPLILHHINSLDREKGIGICEEDAEEAHRRVLYLTRLLLKILPEEDRKCKVWQELCCSVLGDGVFWNLILLGQREIPNLIRDVLKLKKQEIQQITSLSQSSREETTTVTATPAVGLNDDADVHVLLESFLNPVHDVEQPSPIVSRHKPTLDYCLQQSDILYSLIHFLKTEGDLECLQSVLDEFRESKKDTPMSLNKKILIWKHLSHFTRSKNFLENLGFSKVEPAFEAHPEIITSIKSHQRSSSYGGGGGGGSGGLWEQTVVDGFAIYPLLQQPIKDIPSQNSTNSPPDSESLFRRKHTLDPFIAKFYTSVQPSKEISDLPPPETRREGVQSKIYDQSYIRRILVESTEDIITPLIESVVPLMRKGSPYAGIITGWTTLFHPILNSKIQSIIASKTQELTSLESTLSFIDLITEAFLSAFDPKTIPNEESTPSGSSTVFVESSENILWEWVFDTLFDRDVLLKILSSNEERIGLFFVDLLDILVSSLVPQTTTGHT